MSDRVVFQVRLEREQLRRINERMAQVGIDSRNAWIERALEWALEQPVRVEHKTVRT